MSIRYISDAVAASAVVGLMLFAVLVYGQTLETRFFPVVKSFTVGNVTRTETGFDIAGLFEKARPCQYVGLTWYRVGPEASRRVSVAFGDQPAGSSASRAAGVQTFGVWSLGRPNDATGPDIYRGEVRHSCHPLWVTSTTLGPFEFK